MTLASDGWLTKDGVADVARRKACAALLERARARIAAPTRHTTIAWARNAAQDHVAPRDPSACSWCINGALFCEALGTDGNDCLGSHIDAYTALQEQVDPADPPALTVSQVNDGPFGHRRILAVLDKAVVHLRRSQP